MTLDEHLTGLYKADVMGRGDHVTLLAALVTNFGSDPTMQTDAETRLATLRATLAARPYDYVTTKTVKYLSEALET